MRKSLRRILALMIVTVFMIPCVSAFATATITNVEWTTPLGGTVTLSDSPYGDLPVFSRVTYNNVKVTFSDDTVTEAILSIVPVVGGVPADISTGNVGTVMQESVEGKEVTFAFDFSAFMEDGVYAAYIGGADAAKMLGYFKVTDAHMFSLVEGQNFQYDDYKNSLDLKFDVFDSTEFASWEAKKDQMYIKLTDGLNTVFVDPADITFDTEEGIVSIASSSYQKLIPAFGTQLFGNITQCEATIYVPGYMEMIKGKFGLVTPDISSEGFANGVKFDFQIYSATAVPQARCLLGIYDDGHLVSYQVGDVISLQANVDNRVSMTVKQDGIQPSGKFSVKAMLWKGTDVIPLATVIKFP